MDTPTLFRAWKPEQDGDLTEEIYEMLLRSWLLGMVHSASDRGGDDDFADFSFEFGLSYEDAVKIAGSRISLTPAQFAKISDDLKTQAFTLGRLSQLDLIEKVQQAYVKQLESSSVSVKDFIADAREITGKDVGYSQYFDLVFRTNLQKDYNAAKAYDIMTDPPQYLQFVGIEDERQSDICAARSGVILPATDPWWDDNWPPLHYNCRSTVREITGSEAEEVRRNYKQIRADNEVIHKKINNYSPSPGSTFGKMPAKDNAFWATSVSQQDRIIRAMIQEDLNSCAGKTVCRDFKEPKPGFVTLERTTGGIRYPESVAKEKEFNANLETAKVLADSGFYVELHNAYRRNSNPSWDAWLNGIDRAEFKNPLETSLSRRSLENIILGGYDQAQTVVVTLASEAQIEPLKEMIKVNLPGKAERHVIKQMIVIYRGRMVQLSNSDMLKAPGVMEAKLDSLLN